MLANSTYYHTGKPDRMNVNVTVLRNGLSLADPKNMHYVKADLGKNNIQHA